MANVTAYYQKNDLKTRHDLQEISQELTVLSGIRAVSASPYDPKVAVSYEDAEVREDEIDAHMGELGYFAANRKWTH